MSNLEVPYKYPAEQARRPAPSTEIKAEVFREKDAAARAKDGGESKKQPEG